MSDIKFLRRTFFGKTIVQAYDKYATKEQIAYMNQKLDQQVLNYKQSMRVAGLSVQEYLDELYEDKVSRCPICGSNDTVQRRDRVRTSSWLSRTGSSVLQGADYVSPYRRCENCGNDFEQLDFDKELYRKQAERRHQQAIDDTTEGNL